MVELKAIQPAFPLYGTMTLEGGQPYSHALLENHGALVRPELLTALGVAVGDSHHDRHVDVHHSRRRGQRAGPQPRRASASARASSSTSTTCRQPACCRSAAASAACVLARVPDERLDGLVKALDDDFSEDFINTRSYRATDDAIGRDFDRAENYLSLVGLVIVILGGIAVSSVTRVFVLQKIRSIAVLKCLGATSGQIIAVYLLQVMSLGLAGSLLGVAIARGAIVGHSAGARLLVHVAARRACTTR